MVEKKVEPNAVNLLERHKQTVVNEFECFVICPDCSKECGVKAYD